MLPSPISTKVTNVVYFDFETTTDGYVHRPYLVAYKNRQDTVVTVQSGQDCAIKFLQDLAVRYTGTVLCYAHNLGYDGRFILSHLSEVNKVIDRRNNKRILIEGRFNRLNLVFHDTKSLIPYSLKEFSRLFDLDEVKEISFPYHLYTEQICSKASINKKQCFKLYDYIEKNEIKDEYSYKSKKLHLKYAAEYCMIDVILLSKGFDSFRQSILNAYNTDVDNILTAADLSDIVLTSNDCYIGVEPVCGPIREYLSRNVIKDYRMCKDNAMQIGERLYKLSIVGLQPSALRTIPGYPKGKPKIVPKGGLDELESYGIVYCWYVCRFEVVSIGKALNFPTMYSSYIWSNNMIGKIIYGNPIDVNMWKTYQNVELSFIDGYYWDEGMNTAINTLVNQLLEDNATYNRIILHHIIENAIREPMDAVDVFMRGSEHGMLRVWHDNEGTTISAKRITDNKPHEINTYYIKRKADLSTYESYVHCGAMVLSQSRYNMHKLLYILDDCTQYINNGSMYITPEAKNMIPSSMIGAGIGQFFIDYRDRISRFVMAKNCRYFKINDMDKIECDGVPENAIISKCINEFNSDMCTMFRTLMTRPMEFDYLANKGFVWEFDINTIKSYKEYKKMFTFDG